MDVPRLDAQLRSDFEAGFCNSIFNAYTHGSDVLLGNIAPLLTGRQKNHARENSGVWGQGYSRCRIRFISNYPKDNLLYT